MASSIVARGCTTKEGRRCSEDHCTTLLCCYNPGPRCFACEWAWRKAQRAERKAERRQVAA